MKHPTIVQEYKEGQQWETVVMNWLQSDGYIVRPSSVEDNLKKDIDFHFKKNKHLFTSASLKSNHPRYFEAPFIFEEQQERQGKMVDSWWRTGKAKVYFYLKRHVGGGGRLWLIDKRLVKEYVDAYGWDAQKIGISQERLRVQALNNMGNSALSMLRQDTVLRNELGCILLETDSLRRYI